MRGAMDNHIKEFYCQFSDNTPKGNFHKVLALHECPELSWDAISDLNPRFPKGWFELAHLNSSDRISFLRDFWLSKLPFQLYCPTFFSKFFDSLDDIGIYAIKRTYDDPYEANLVYSLKDDKGFFRGNAPASTEEIEALQRSFSDFTLPADFLAFLEIHNGFSKTTDVTGITNSKLLPKKYSTFQELLNQEVAITTTKGKAVNPHTLIPFYESFGMPFFQCFWSEWYPEQEMGNVYYSGMTKTISDVDGKDPSSEGMAFSTFLDWLMFYMERIE